MHRKRKHIPHTLLIKDFLRSIGEDPARTGLKETPKRVVRMWKELYRGYDPRKKPRLTVFNNHTDGITYDQMICTSGSFYSHCEHHLLPFFGHYHFAYIPDRKIIGLSKVARVVDYYAARLQTQERMVEQIVTELEKALASRGIALILKARHLCQEMRGVRKTPSLMITSDLRGLFRDRFKTRMEFLKMGSFL